MGLRTLPDPDNLPALDRGRLPGGVADGLGPQEQPPRFLVLYGSLREVSYSRLIAEEGARLLRLFGAEVRIFDPSGLPHPDGHPEDHPEVRQLRDLAVWSDGMVWSSPEWHGQMSGLLKTQLDHIPLEMGAIRPTQGRTLALMQVSGGAQSFNAVNGMRILARWLRMLAIPNQVSVPRAWQEFDQQGRMRPSLTYDRIVDVMEELYRTTVLTRPHRDLLADRYSQRPAEGD